MRVGEVLNLTAMDLDDQKLTIKNPKSGKRAEVVFIPKKVADRLKDYIRTKGIAGATKNISHLLYCGPGYGKKSRGSDRHSLKAT